ncbi:NAD/NADP octopine/nopaline dehydrogenase family protein [Rhodoplanes roseus]|nr:NAD/NADP octopine/nopaline dehydrogenase family protein [Rhodoplanes roseus]
MKVAVLGAGAIGLATSATLAAAGHAPSMWSPSGRSTTGFGRRKTITATGALSGGWEIDIAETSEQAIRDADAVVLAVDAPGHRPVMEAVAPLLRPGVPFIIGAAHSLSGLYLSRLLAQRGVVLPIVSWNTTVGTAHRIENGVVDMRTVRPRIYASVMPSRLADEALATCRTLFGDRFERCADALRIALLSNCNPVFHVPVCLLNVSRIEHGETWAPYAQTTDSVGRLMEVLDRERIAIGAAFGLPVHSVNEHFARSFKVPLGSMAEMNALLAERGRGPKGPTTVAHRFLAQDLPFGLAFAEAAAEIAGVPAPVHQATLTLAGATLGTDYRAANNLLAVLGLAGRTADDLLGLATEGAFGTA